MKIAVFNQEGYYTTDKIYNPELMAFLFGLQKDSALEYSYLEICCNNFRVNIRTYLGEDLSVISYELEGYESFYTTSMRGIKDANIKSNPLRALVKEYVNRLEIVDGAILNTGISEKDVIRSLPSDIAPYFERFL